MPKLNPKLIQIGDTLTFWVFGSGFTKHTDLKGTVSAITQVEIGGKIQTGFKVSEMADTIILAHQITASERSKKSTIAQLKHCIEVIESAHVQSVEVSLEEETDWMRVYSVITNHHFQKHQYVVRVYDAFNEMTMAAYREAKCSCAAAAHGLICRHVIKVLELDSDKTGRELSYGYIKDYSAHRYQKVA